MNAESGYWWRAVDWDLRIWLNDHLFPNANRGDVFPGESEHTRALISFGHFSLVMGSTLDMWYQYLRSGVHCFCCILLNLVDKGCRRYRVNRVASVLYLSRFYQNRSPRNWGFARSSVHCDRVPAMSGIVCWHTAMHLLRLKDISFWSWANGKTTVCRIL